MVGIMDNDLNHYCCCFFNYCAYQRMSMVKRSTTLRGDRQLIRLQLFTKQLSEATPLSMK